MHAPDGPTGDDADHLIRVLERIARDLEHVLLAVIACAVLLAAIVGVLLAIG